MTKEEIDSRAYDLAMHHWLYIENLLWAHGEKAEKVDIAKFHYLEAFKHGYKHCWEDSYFPGQIQIVDSPYDYELYSSPNPQGNQAS